MVSKRIFNRRNLRVDIRRRRRRNRQFQRKLHDRSRHRHRLVHADEDHVHSAECKFAEDQGFLARLGRALVSAWVVARGAR